MPAPKVPTRLAWAVARLDPLPRDCVLEIGCGPGVAAQLIAARLDGGHVHAIDRSWVAVRRARERLAADVAAGRATVEQRALADLDAPEATFDRALAVNVNVFWTGPAARECEILQHVVRPDGLVVLAWGGKAPGHRDVGETVAALLAGRGFGTDVVHDEREGEHLLAVLARRS